MDQISGERQGANDAASRESDDSEAIRRTGGEDAGSGRDAELRGVVGAGNQGEAAPSYASYGAHQEQERGGPGDDAALRSDTDRSDVHPGGKRNTGAAGDDLPQPQVGGLDRHPDGEPSGPALEGSNDPSTFNDRGRVVGPDSPAGDIPSEARSGEGQGDDLANRLGGGEGRGVGMTGNGASGDMRSSSSGPSSGDRLPASGEAPDAGSPGGLGGPYDRGTASSRPPGGDSPGLAGENDSGRGE